MKIITPGHLYELPNFEYTATPGQRLQFIEKRINPLAPEAGTMETVNDGTTNEAVLEMLIDRMGHLQSKFPCRENAIVITHLETALLWLEYRTKKRQARGVEGKHLA